MPSGGASVVASGGTSTVASGGTSVVASGGTSAVASGGTSAVASGGTSTVASGGTSTVASGGTSVVASGGTSSTGGAGSGGTSAGSGGSGEKVGGLEVPASPYIVVDQFGYPPAGIKMAVVRDPKVGFDANESFSPGSSHAVVDAKTGVTVIKGALTKWNDGATDDSSGDSAWQFDFSAL